MGRSFRKFLLPALGFLGLVLAIPGYFLFFDQEKATGAPRLTPFRGSAHGESQPAKALHAFLDETAVVWPDGQLPRSTFPSPSRLSDPNVSLKQKAAWARQIGNYGGWDDWWECMEMTGLPEEVRVALIDGIGASGRPEANEFLRAALDDPSPRVRRALLRGLGQTGRDEDMVFLGEFIRRPDTSAEETTEAALALGASASPQATGLLIQAYRQNPEGDLGEYLLLALCQRPHGESGEFLKKFLANPETDPAQKRVVLSGLGRAGHVNPDFFLPYLESGEQEIRRGAYEGLGALASPAAGEKLFARLSREPDPVARIAIYEGLMLSRWRDPMQLHHFAMAERDAGIRLYAARAVALGLQGKSITDPAVDVFHRTWLPELVRAALADGGSDGFQALTIISLLPSAQGQQALVRLATQAKDPAIRAKAQELIEATSTPSIPSAH